MNRQSKWASWQQLAAQPQPTEEQFQVAPEMEDWVNATFVEPETDGPVEISLTSEEPTPLAFKKIVKTKK